MTTPPEVLLNLDRSWGWTFVLPTSVSNNGTVQVPTPGYNAGFADPKSAQLSVNEGIVLLPGKATVSFGGATATVTNLTGRPWAAGSRLYVYVKVKQTTGDVLQQITALDARVTALEAKLP